MTARKAMQVKSLPINTTPVEKLWKAVEISENVREIGGLMFSIPGDPVARKSGTRQRYTEPQETMQRDWIATVAKSAARANGAEWERRWLPMQGRLVLGVIIYRAVPVTNKPDLSNYVKLVEDALTKVIYRDDAQIVEYLPGTRKEDSPTPCTRILIVQQIGLERLGLANVRGF